MALSTRTLARLYCTSQNSALSPRLIYSRHAPSGHPQPSFCRCHWRMGSLNLAMSLSALCVGTCLCSWPAVMSKVPARSTYHLPTSRHLVLGTAKTRTRLLLLALARPPESQRRPPFFWFYPHGTQLDSGLLSSLDTTIQAGTAKNKLACEMHT